MRQWRLSHVRMKAGLEELSDPNRRKSSSSDRAKKAKIPPFAVKSLTLVKWFCVISAPPSKAGDTLLIDNPSQVESIPLEVGEAFGIKHIYRHRGSLFLLFALQKLRLVK
jgi:hypothetical protein